VRGVAVGEDSVVSTVRQWHRPFTTLKGDTVIH